MNNETNIKDINLATLLPSFAIYDGNKEENEATPNNREVKPEENNVNNIEIDKSSELTSISLIKWDKEPEKDTKDVNIDNKTPNILTPNNESAPNNEIITETEYKKVANEYNEAINNINVEVNQINEEKKAIQDLIKATNIDYTNLGFSKEDAELLKSFDKSFKSIDSNYNKYQYIIEERNVTKHYLDKITFVYNQVQTDRKNLNTAITSLKSWYNNYKEGIINNLQENINYMLNGFFDNNHKIKLEQDIQRNNSIVNMVEVNDKGEKIGDIGVMLSGAEKQMSGFLIQTSILNTLDSNFVILDEAFSSFGIEEVARLPQLLQNLDDMQIIIMEHKDELFQEFPIKTIHLERDLEDGTRIANITE